MSCTSFLNLILILTCLPVLIAAITALAMFKLTMPKRAIWIAMRFNIIMFSVTVMLLVTKLAIERYYKTLGETWTHFLSIVALTFIVIVWVGTLRLAEAKLAILKYCKTLGETWTHFLWAAQVLIHCVELRIRDLTSKLSLSASKFYNKLASQPVFQLIVRCLYWVEWLREELYYAFYSNFLLLQCIVIKFYYDRGWLTPEKLYAQTQILLEMLHDIIMFILDIIMFILG